MPIELTSPHNPRIKTVVRLAKHRDRDAERMTVVEGTREVQRALAAGVIPIDAFVCPPLVQDEEGRAAVRELDRLAAQQRTHLFHVTPELFAKLTYRTDSGGLLMTIPYLDVALERLRLSSPPFLVVVEGVEKPGNLGAILRTADAAGVDGVIVCSQPDRPGTDLHNPNVVRASLGTLFTVPVAETSTEQAVAWLAHHAIRIIAATPDADALFTDVEMTGPVAVALGSEAQGLSAVLATAAAQRVRIPMHGAADSLNLAISAALMLYEVVRQRGPASV